MTLLGFKTILHKRCRSGKNSEGPAENSWCWTYVQQNENKFQKVCNTGLTVFPLYRTSKCYWRRKPKKTTELSLVTDMLINTKNPSKI